MNRLITRVVPLRNWDRLMSRLIMRLVPLKNRDRLMSCLITVVVPLRQRTDELLTSLKCPNFERDLTKENMLNILKISPIS